MKKIFRMLVFSGVSLYVTSLWNKGFILNLTWQNFLTATLAIAILYYLVNPFLKIIFLPVNFLTFGLMSLVLYFLLFHFVVTHYSIASFKNWTFNSIKITYYSNIALTALSVSTIISFLEKFL